MLPLRAESTATVITPVTGVPGVVDTGPAQGPGGPILVISNSSNPFTQYYAEILRTEGLNAFYVMDSSQISASTLSGYDTAILGEMPLSGSQVTVLTNWVNGGGNLIVMRPDKQLASLLGLTETSATLSNGYLLVNTGSAPGQGIVNQTIQFHGTADQYTLSGASTIATLYSSATSATSNPAVTLHAYGAGQAAAFTYDLARSVVYTRQGNPAWSGKERDGITPIRPDDLFYGAANGDIQPDWIDLNKVAIPQADEQQRLLANLIINMNFAKKPLPRFWYFPREVTAVVIMTDDDHAGGGTAGRFDSYITRSTPGCSVDNWECIRSTSNLYTGTLTSAQAASYNAAGFEITCHINTNCADWTPSSLRSFYADQLNAFRAYYPGIPSPATNRTHCIAWSDYDTEPQVELDNGIRLDTSYYYYPPAWVADRPGMFTGSGMPMRFARSDGTMIDVYQATTQMTDESGQTFPFTINTLLDNAIGSQGYYGAFTANMHADTVASTGSDAIITAAQQRGVPVVSQVQMLRWLDGRNASAFRNITWDGSRLNFTVSVGEDANGLTAMVPIPAGRSVSAITFDGLSVPFSRRTIKGITYAVFYANAGSHQVVFSDTTSPVIVPIFWRNSVTGQNAVWYMDGATFLSGALLPSMTDLNWTIVGVADFNGDTKPDLVWRNSVTGQNAVWYMDGLTFLSGALLPSMTDLNWTIVGVADFNGDTKPDLVWRNSVTGQNAVWYMDGLTLSQGVMLTPLSDLNWQIMGVADFNGDTKPDLVWRNSVTGQNAVWYMDGLTFLSGALLPSMTDLNWTIVGVADFNGDTKPDLVWRNSVTGQNAVWYMNGATLTRGLCSPPSAIRTGRSWAWLTSTAIASPTSSGAIALPARTRSGT